MAKRKLIIIIPAFNEEKSIFNVIKSIPSINGINQEIIVINDGSSDNTLSFAKRAGAIVTTNKKTLGLGYSFKTGLNKALKHNADIIVNLDADGQYDPSQILALIRPLLENGIDLVVGNRFFKNSLYKESLLKKYGNYLISFLFSKFFMRKKVIFDMQSSFRAFNKNLAILLVKKLTSKYNYAQEMLILAKSYNFRIQQIPVKCVKRINGKSHLIKNVFIHLLKVYWIALRTYTKNKVRRI